MTVMVFKKCQRSFNNVQTVLQVSSSDPPLALPEQLFIFLVKVRLKFWWRGPKKKPV